MVDIGGFIQAHVWLSLASHILLLRDFRTSQYDRKSLASGYTFGIGGASVRMVKDYIVWISGGDGIAYLLGCSYTLYIPSIFYIFMCEIMFEVA